MAAVFLDLDGTMTDPKPGITAAVQYALGKVGLPVPDADDLTWVIGPPLIESFAKIGADDPHEALDHYRSQYDDGGGLTDAVVHAGIVDGLEALRAAGHRLYVATAKPIYVARKVTAHFGLSPFFLDEFGPSMDGRLNDKAELLAHALEKTGEDPAASVMVGDRHHDIRAARLNAMPSIAVTWRYGNADEHSAADAVLTDSLDFGAGVLRFLNARLGA